MQSQESASLSRPLARLKARTLMLEEKLAVALRIKPSASPPSRIAVIGNYLPRHAESQPSRRTCATLSVRSMKPYSCWRCR